MLFRQQANKQEAKSLNWKELSGLVTTCINLTLLFVC